MNFMYIFISFASALVLLCPLIRPLTLAHVKKLVQIYKGSIARQPKVTNELDLLMFNIFNADNSPAALVCEPQFTDLLVDEAFFRLILLAPTDLRSSLAKSLVQKSFYCFSLVHSLLSDSTVVSDLFKNCTEKYKLIPVLSAYTKKLSNLSLLEESLFPSNLPEFFVDFLKSDDSLCPMNSAETARSADIEQYLSNNAELPSYIYKKINKKLSGTVIQNNKVVEKCNIFSEVLLLMKFTKTKALELQMLKTCCSYLLLTNNWTGIIYLLITLNIIFMLFA
jgi:hypothetical protein